MTTPPSPLAQRNPLLALATLELVHDRAHQASSAALPPPRSGLGTAAPTDETPLSEQAVLCLALIDCLRFLRVDDLEEWLPSTAKLINAIQDVGMRTVCMERFWDALTSGEMDVDRAYFCVTWWSTRGGRELIMFGTEEDAHHEVTTTNEAYMSGAVGSIAPSSKL
jgi:hypothetical protein